MLLENINDFRKLEGKALPEGEWMEVTQEMINDFAKATGDFQWIHTDEEKAKQFSPFKKPIAHGFYSISMLSKLLGDLISVKSVKMGVNYGLNKVRFPKPILVNDSIRIAGQVSKIEDYADSGVKVTWNCAIEIKGSDKPACVAEFVSLMFE